MMQSLTNLNKINLFSPVNNCLEGSWDQSIAVSEENTVENAKNLKINERKNKGSITPRNCG